MRRTKGAMQNGYQDIHCIYNRENLSWVNHVATAPPRPSQRPSAPLG